ncbi:MAG: UPF0175 family protein [Caldilineae bacterium]|nr:MAG: UPF0175 family protein [Caldilineae bacterium]
MKTTTLEIQVPAEWADELKDPMTVLEILSLGMEEHRLRRALALYQAGAGSLGYVAELAGIPLRVLLEEARKRDVLPMYDDEAIKADMTAS